MNKKLLSPKLSLVKNDDDRRPEIVPCSVTKVDSYYEEESTAFLKYVILGNINYSKFEGVF